MCGIPVGFVDPPRDPDDGEDPSKRCRVNMPEVLGFEEMLETAGVQNMFQMLGRLSANMDTVYHEISQRLANDATGKLFLRWFGNVPRNLQAELVTLAQRLGFAGGVMDAAYAAGATASGNGGYRPQPIGKLKDLQNMWERGDKPHHNPDPDPYIPPDYRCYWVEVDTPGPGDELGPIQPGIYD